LDLIQSESEGIQRERYGVCLVSFVCLVCWVEPDDPDKPSKPNPILVGLLGSSPHQWSHVYLPAVDCSKGNRYFCATLRNEVSSPGGNRSVLVSRKRIEEAILAVRGHLVMSDVDLAGLYGVATKICS
jgi:hypothetical protein